MTTAEMSSQGTSLSSTTTSSSANPSRTSASNNNPVERKKNAATGSAARRKLTPHPLSNPDHPDMHLQEMVTLFGFFHSTKAKIRLEI